MSITTLPSNTTVLIAGGGPVGLALPAKLVRDGMYLTSND